MKKILNIILVANLFLLFSSCEKDPMEKVNDGNWNNERNVLSITLENQIGPAVIERDAFTNTIKLFVNAKGLDLSAVKIDELVLSYGASSNITKGGTLNFNNPDSKSTLTVTSAKGKSLEWEVIMDAYDMFYDGNWSIQNEIIYVHQEWGSEFTKDMEVEFAGIAAEYDNNIEFINDGFDNGSPYGRIINSAGDDGLYGTFLQNAYDPNNADQNASVDMTSKLRHLIPEGESEWKLNLETNVMTITKDGLSADAKISKTDAGMSFVYNLPKDHVWDANWGYGAWDNYWCWSYQYDILFVR